MRTTHRLSFPRASLLVLLLLDLMAALAFVLDQWLAFDPAPAWVLSALLSVPGTILLWPSVDSLVSRPTPTRDVSIPGDKIPQVGQ